MKPVLSHLRAQVILCSIYLDDLYLQGDTFTECTEHIQYALKLLSKLGFVVHPEKSNFTPSQIIDHLSFQFNSVSMNVGLTNERQEKLVKKCKELIQNKKLTIRNLAEVIGTLVSCSPGVEYGIMNYRYLELQKIECLKSNFGNFEAIIPGLTDSSKENIDWWIQNHQTPKSISHGNPQIVISTDASQKGWGAVVAHTSTDGQWSQEEGNRHINVLELHAALLGLQAFQSQLTDKHVHIQLDNSTAVCYIRNMGSTHSVECNELSLSIWLWCIENRVWLTATHLPGVDNVIADQESRHFNNSNTEWTLKDQIFQKIKNVLGSPQIDLFATRNNNRVPKYFSWRPDPGAIGTDAFAQTWNYDLMYAFPPFSLINRVLQKVILDQAELILIVPMWPTQTWFARLLQLLERKPVLIPTRRHTIYLPHNQGEIHPLWKKLKLMACRLSRKPSKAKVFLNKHKTLLCNPGESQQNLNTSAISISGLFFQNQTFSIPYTQL